MDSKLNLSKIKLLLVLTIFSMLLFISVDIKNLTAISEDTTPPTISDIGHFPIEPMDTTPVLINCTVTDSAGIQSVTLYYRVNGGDWISKTMVKIGSTNTYENTTGLFATDDFVEFYIVAVDNSYNHNVATDNNAGFYYAFTVGYDDLEAPIITNVTFTPVAPKADELVTINCEVSDDYSGISCVYLYYRTNNSEWTQIAINHDSLNYYQVTIGPFVANVLIEFYITAIDGSSHLNEGINNNGSSYFSFLVLPIPTGVNPISYIVPIIAVVTIGILYKRRK